MFSCQTKEEKALHEYQALYENLKQCENNCTHQEYNQICEAYDQMEVKTQECEFTEEQRHQLEELKGKIFAVLVKIKVRLTVDELGGAMDDAASFLKGVEEECLESQEIK